MSTYPGPDTAWFTGLGLGIFIHWGHAATRGWELSWQMVGGVVGQYPPRDPVPCEEYFANAASFDPVRFDAADWAAQIAAAGARYVVFTAKHHDGFALWDTALSDYSSVRTAPCRRDILAELLPALRAAGLRVGLYFSIVDWYSPLYPRYTDDTVCKPYVVGTYPVSPATWGAYRTYMLGQLTELLTAYGPVDIVWLDGGFEHTEAEWDFRGIREHIRSLAPNCLVNDRCTGYGDFSTPEQSLPEVAPAGPWEQCLTMNESWSHVPADTAWKSPRDLVEALVETVIRGGNLLLDIGPDGDGTFPPPVVERLDALGAWVRSNGTALTGLSPGLRPGQCRLPTARQPGADGERVYVYLTLDPGPSLRVRGLPVRRVTGVSLVADAQPLPYTAHPYVTDIQSGTPDPEGDVVVQLPHPLPALVPVVAIDLAAR